MAGIYVHIPFCRKQCSYCDFYKSTLLENKKTLLVSLMKELDHKANYLEGDRIETIYIGGGTPSVLSIEEINLLLSKISAVYKVSDKAEITFEANPDDLNKTYLERLYNNTVINRLSIGIQSFIDRDLRLLNRRHDSTKAKHAIRDTLKAGFSDVSIDLIYSIPGMSMDEWICNLNTAFSFNIHHLSAYFLTFEPGTCIYGKLKNKEIDQVKEEQSLEQYKKLIEIAEKAGYIQYEISNFSLPGHLSKHNSGYWSGKKYIGIGPSAHSYNIKTRQWNVSDNAEYIMKINQNRTYFEMEHLNLKTRFNEYIMTGLRTKWGIDLKEIEKKFGTEFYRLIINKALPFLKNNDIEEKENHYFLTSKGIFIADYIISAMFLD
ncbi:MAG: radical SAM family heme chaperone HemW [Bacteroidales bacterium]|nr:radical SAM family heme chaperone HemW [Bacteroidales bacterium]